jgi:hypothetical protein
MENKFAEFSLMLVSAAESSAQGRATIARCLKNNQEGEAEKTRAEMLAVGRYMISSGMLFIAGGCGDDKEVTLQSISKFVNYQMECWAEAEKSLKKKYGQ